MGVKRSGGCGTRRFCPLAGITSPDVVADVATHPGQEVILGEEFQGFVMTGVSCCRNIVMITNDLATEGGILGHVESVFKGDDVVAALPHGCTHTKCLGDQGSLICVHGTKLVQVLRCRFKDGGG